MSTRQRIIDATMRLVAERGLNDVTMVVVAEAAGVARGTVYNHYDDIASILADAAAAHNAEAIASLRQALLVVDDPVDSLQQLAHHLAAIASHGHAPDLRDGLPPQWREQARAFDHEVEQQLRRIVAEGMAGGAFRDDLDPTTVSIVLRQALAGMSEAIGASPDNAAEVLAQTIALLRGAVQTTQGSTRT